MVPLVAAFALAWLHGGVVVRCDNPAAARPTPPPLVEIDPRTGAASRLPFLTNGWPFWSPDESAVAVTESVALQVDQTRLLAPDGTETALLRGATEVAWSPDGRRLAYAISFPADFVHVVDADGANDRVVATGVEPSWSPDGTQLALWDDGWISVLDLATGAEHRLVRARDPRWSPRGDWIAYSTRGGLGVVRPDGSGAHRLTRLSAEYTVYAWSPDGSRLAALFDFRSGRTRLAVVPLLGRTRFAALADELHGVPVWAPDGTTVAADDGNDVRLVNARTLRARGLAPPC